MLPPAVRDTNSVTLLLIEFRPPVLLFAGLPVSMNTTFPKDESFKRISKFGKVPALKKEDGDVLFESEGTKLQSYLFDACHL